MTALETKQETQEQAYELATIAEIMEDGVRLIFDGESAATDKAYKANVCAMLRVGQRVVVRRIAGSYVVEFPVGAPNTEIQIPAGGTNGQMLVKDGTEPYALRWATAPTNYIPAGGSDGQMLVKNGTGTSYTLRWATAPDADKLKSATGTLTLSGKTLQPGAADYVIGTINYPITYHAKTVRIYYSSTKYATLACDYSGKLTVNGTAIT